MFSYQISDQHKLHMLEPHNAEELFSLCEKNRAYLRGSRAVPERLQFVHEGTLREAVWLYDHFINLEVYGCLQPEWADFTSEAKKA